jgi:hypothetical protein
MVGPQPGLIRAQLKSWPLPVEHVEYGGFILQLAKLIALVLVRIGLGEFDSAGWIWLPRLAKRSYWPVRSRDMGVR